MKVSRLLLDALETFPNFVIIDKNANVVYLNESYAVLLGIQRDAAIGKPVYAEDSYVDFGTSPEFGEVFKGSGRSGPNIARTRSIRALRLMAVTTRTRCTTSLLP
mgnify:CR=1 FL=1